MSDIRFQNIGNHAVDFQDMMLRIKDKTSFDINVGSFGIVKEYNVDKGTAKVQFIPNLKNENPKITTCVCTIVSEIGDMVFVIFADRNFWQNYKQHKSGQKLTPLINNEILHSETYGIVIRNFDRSENVDISIGENKHWYINGVDTGVSAEGKDGADGKTPYIGDNGNWWIGDEDTGVRASGYKDMYNTTSLSDVKIDEIEIQGGIVLTGEIISSNVNVSNSLSLRSSGSQNLINNKNILSIK